MLSQEDILEHDFHGFENAGTMNGHIALEVVHIEIECPFK
jgi:hypothetical protein